MRTRSLHVLYTLPRLLVYQHPSCSVSPRLGMG